MKIDRCPLCGSTTSQEIFKLFRPKQADATGRHTEDLFGRAGKIVRCTGCGLVRQDDRPDVPYTGAEDEEYISEEAGNRQTFRGILDRIGRYRSPPGEMLDIGCGPGVLLDEARARGWKTFGVEPSRWGAEQARAKGLEVHHGTLEEAGLQEATYDVVVAADVIEHVDDPFDFAKRINALLRPGGVVLIATPNVESLIARTLRRWWWSVIPNHYWLFSKRTLEDLMRRGGFDVLEAATHPKTFSVDYYAGRFGGYNDTLGKITRGIGRSLGGRERLVTPDFRDRMALIARKE